MSLLYHFFFVSIVKQSHPRLLKYKHVPMFIRLTMAGDEMILTLKKITKKTKIIMMIIMALMTVKYIQALMLS